MMREWGEDLGRFFTPSSQNLPTFEAESLRDTTRTQQALASASYGPKRQSRYSPEVLAPD